MPESPQSWPLGLKVSTPNYRKDPESGSPDGTVHEPPRRRLRQHFSAKLKNNNTDYILLLCWFTTGLLDSTIFNAYRTFVSMQTGNSLF